MNLLEPGISLEEALTGFDFGGQVAGALRYGKGHINDTFAVYTQQPNGSARRFILQRVNTHVFKNPAQLMENIVGITRHLRQRIAENGGDPNRETLTVLPARTGGALYTTADGGVWRCYLFVEGTVCYQSAESPALFEAAGRAFGNFNRLLEDYPAGTLYETIPDFHDTRVRFVNFKKALQADAKGRAKTCAPEIEFALAHAGDCPVLMDLLDAGKLPLRVTHNDTKLNNILMDEKNGQGVCVVDLDTVMPGLSLHDFGDAIRAGANTATEDEKDLGVVHFSLPLFEAFTAGYLHTAGPAMTSLEKELLPWGAKLMTLECGIRFLTDYLEGDLYFSRISRSLQNLERCRTQFKLVADMERDWDEMQRIVNHYIK